MMTFEQAQQHAQYQRIPTAVLHGLYDYIERHQAPGHFLTAVLCHDLFEATGRSDEGSWIALRELVVFIYNEVRSDCHGSPAKVSAWLQNTVGSL